VASTDSPHKDHSAGILVGGSAAGLYHHNVPHKRLYGIHSVRAARATGISHYITAHPFTCTLCSSASILRRQSASHYLRLQRTERAALACEIAAQGMEEACEELEKASEVHTSIPFLSYRLREGLSCIVSVLQTHRQTIMPCTDWA
jgi:hypothetical protein